MATSNSADQNDVLFTYKSCKIVLKQGNLLDEKDVQFVVIPVPPKSESSDSFAIFKEFNIRADTYFKNELTNIRRDIQPGQPRKAIKDRYGYIFIILPYLGNEKKAYDIVKRNYTSCLKLAADNDGRSIAFPTIGCGGRGFDSSVVAGLIFSAFADFLETKIGKKMDEIRLVVYNDDVWKNFTRSFTDLALETKSKIKFEGFVSKPSTAEEPPQHQPQEERRDDPDGNSENDDSSRKSHNKKTSTNLNPNVPEFQPKSRLITRDCRRYYINKRNTELHIIQGDITKTKVDAIVNAANERMCGGSGVDGIIHSAAGDKFLDACKRHKEIYRDVRLPTGRSRILLSYDMRQTTHYIINTAGPVYDSSMPDECKTQLQSCYKTSLELANLYDLETIGFTAISCGIFGYPIDEGAEVALTTIDSEAHGMKKVMFVLKDDDIYDAWIRKARELKFISMDKIDNEPASKPKESTSTSRTDSHDETQSKDIHSTEEDQSKNEQTTEIQENKNNDAKKSDKKALNSSPPKSPPAKNSDKETKKTVGNGVVGRGRVRDPTNKS